MHQFRGARAEAGNSDFLDEFPQLDPGHLRAGPEHFRDLPGAGITVRPGHQGCPDAGASAALLRRISSPYQFDSISIRPFRRARRSAQPKTRCARISVAAVVTSNRNRTSASDKAGNILMACEPSRLRRISSIQYTSGDRLATAARMPGSTLIGKIAPETT